MPADSIFAPSTRGNRSRAKDVIDRGDDFFLELHRVRTHGEILLKPGLRRENPRKSPIGFGGE